MYGSNGETQIFMSRPKCPRYFPIFACLGCFKPAFGRSGLVWGAPGKLLGTPGGPTGGPGQPRLPFHGFGVLFLDSPAQHFGTLGAMP